jgi:hypothetical protein
MRGILGWAIALLLVVPPAMAKAGGAAGDNPAPANAGAAATGEASPDATATAKAGDTASLEVEIDELRDLLQSQTKLLQNQGEQLSEQQKKMELLENELKAAKEGRENLVAAPAPTSATIAPSATISASSAIAPSTASPTVLTASAPATSPAAQPVGATPAPQVQPDSPIQFHLGSAYITPLGFMDFTAVVRDHNAGGGIGSNFAAVPYQITSATGAINLSNSVSEARLSMQNSRFGFRVDAAVKGAHVIGYMEADFLGNNATNVAVSSNSNTLRSRLYWVDVSKGSWEVLGGQTWSLITPGRSGISPLPANIFNTNDIDVNYQIGLVWGRIPELRFVYHPSVKMAFAVALDQQEQYVGGSAGAPVPVLPTGGTVNGGVATLFGTQLDNQTTTVNAPEVFPDLIVKAAFDPTPKMHFEVGGVERQFKVAVNSAVATNSPVVTKAITGGGIFANINVMVLPGLRLLTNNFYGSAVGRYIYGQVPDVIVRANGSLSPIHAASTVSGFEYTWKNTLLYGYYGAVYAYKNRATVNGLEYGYGVDAFQPGPVTTNYAAAIAENRTIQEYTIGVNETLWKDAKYGAINLMAQYSYLFRDPWSVSPGNPLNAALNLGFLDLRYTLPGGAPSNAALGLK